MNRPFKIYIAFLLLVSGAISAEAGGPKKIPAALRHLAGKTSNKLPSNISASALENNALNLALEKQIQASIQQDLRQFHQEEELCQRIEATAGKIYRNLIEPKEIPGNIFYKNSRYLKGSKLLVASPSTLEFFGAAEHGSISSKEKLHQKIAKRLLYLNKSKSRIYKSYLEVAGRGTTELKRMKISYEGNYRNLNGNTFDSQHLIFSLETFLGSNNKLIRHSSLSHLKDSSPLGTKGKIFWNASLSQAAISIIEAEGMEFLDIFYTNLLRCSPKNPCHLIQIRDSFLVFSPDERFWLRLGAHEFENINRMHIHLHTYHDVHGYSTGSGRAGHDRLMINYVIPIPRNPVIDHIEMGRADYRMRRRRPNQHIENLINFPERFEGFVTYPLQKMVRAGVLIAH